MSMQQMQAAKHVLESTMVIRLLSTLGPFNMWKRVLFITMQGQQAWTRRAMVKPLITLQRWLSDTLLYCHLAAVGEIAGNEYIPFSLTWLHSKSVSMLRRTGMICNVSPNHMFSGSVWYTCPGCSVISRWSWHAFHSNPWWSHRWEKWSSILRIVMPDPRDQIVQVSYFKKEKHWVPES